MTLEYPKGAIPIKNDYEIRGDVTSILLVRRTGEVVETIIDTEQLAKVEDIKWHAVNWPETNDFYVQGNLLFGTKDNKKTVILHRWLLGNPKGLVVDHINHNTLDNRLCNLQAVSNSANGQNRLKLQSNNKSGVRGVSWHKGKCKWEAKMTVNGRFIYLGAYETVAEAQEVVVEARAELMPYSQEAMQKRGVI